MRRQNHTRWTKSYLSTLLATVVTAAFCSPVANAYYFILPSTPTLPSDLQKDPTINVGTGSQTNSESNPSGGSYDWWGPTAKTSADTRTGNYVNISISKEGVAIGGWSEDGLTVSGNRVVIASGGNMFDTYGGYSSAGNVENNVAEIYGSTSQGGRTYGGYARKGGDVAGNMVFIRSGAKAHSQVTGGNAGEGVATANVVVLEKNATMNSGYINGGTGMSANENMVFIYGTALATVYGGQATNRSGTANKNLVYVGNGATVKVDVFAAFGSAMISDASNNVLIVDNATIERHAAAAGGLTYQGQGNELHLLGQANVRGWAGASDKTHTGLVHIRGTATVGCLKGFDELVFELTDDNVDKAALTITNAYKVLENEEPILDLTGVSTFIDADKLTKPADGALLMAMTQGEAIHVLVDDETSFADETSVFVDKSWSVSQDVVDVGSIEADKFFINEDGELVTSLNGVETVLGEKATSASNESHTLSESLLGTVAFVNQGAEFIADEGIRAMTEAAYGNHTALFGAVHGGTSRYKTGSHVDVDGATLVTGVVTQVDSWMMAGFLEAGWASSESHVTGSKGDGDHNYYGVGAATRYSFENPFYVEGALRIGQASTEFDGRYADASAHYDADGVYCSMHVGAGYLTKMTDALTLDLYGRYVFTYLEGDAVGLETAGGETFDMDNTMTHAFRLGARVTGVLGPAAKWRMGLAYEHVADGDAESDVVLAGTRTALDVPSLEGDTGIMEIGVSMKPTETSRWFTDLSVKGYAGDREGVSGSATIGYVF